MASATTGLHLVTQGEHGASTLTLAGPVSDETIRYALNVSAGHPVYDAYSNAASIARNIINHATALSDRFKHWLIDQIREALHAAALSRPVPALPQEIPSPIPDAVQARLEGMEVTIGALTANLALTEGTAETLRTQLNASKGATAALEEKVAELEEANTELEGEVAKLKAKNDKLKAKKEEEPLPRKRRA
jgi:septal ring factor EnvC (AmiA/AmiB activator)